jgi:hypothetical protein
MIQYWFGTGNSYTEKEEKLQCYSINGTRDQIHNDNQIRSIRKDTGLCCPPNSVLSPHIDLLLSNTARTGAHASDRAPKLFAVYCSRTATVSSASASSSPSSSTCDDDDDDDDEDSSHSSISQLEALLVRQPRTDLNLRIPLLRSSLQRVSKSSSTIAVTTNIVVKAGFCLGQYHKNGS